jgi:hypothetical protein
MQVLLFHHMYSLFTYFGVALHFVVYAVFL